MHDVVHDMAIYIASEGDHKFMVSHDVNSEEFPRKDSYEQCSHMSIVANKFDELPSPIVCPKLKLLLLELCFKDSFKLQDNFFDEMGELNVLSLRRRYVGKTIFRFPASIQKLSNLRTLCLSNLKLDDISIIRELVTLEILSIRCYRSQNEVGEVKSISSGVLSRLVRLEDLHMVELGYCSYTILREVESLSRLTALTLSEWSGDVMYKNLDLPSKLARYTLQLGEIDILMGLQQNDRYGWFFDRQVTTSIMDDYDKIVVLKVNETAPFGDWIRQLLKESEAVYSIGKGSNYVMTSLQVNEFQNLKYLCLSDCDSVTHLSNMTREIMKFPNLYQLELQFLKCLAHFCSDNVEGIVFPRLQRMSFFDLPEFQNFWPTANNSNPLFHEKVSCPNLEDLNICELPSISALCSHQLPIGYFSKLVTLVVVDCKKLRNLMSPSVVRGLLSLKMLGIYNCESMTEVILDEEQQREGIITIFPMLEQLTLNGLPELRHFFLSVHTLEIPSLGIVEIEDCPEMKTFVQEGISVSTPNLEIVNDDMVKVDDLNKWTQQRFTSKEQQASQSTTDDYESEANDDGNESEIRS